MPNAGVTAAAPEASRPASSPLAPLRWVAVLGVLAFVVGRAIAPAIAGSAVGLDRVIDKVSFAGAALSQAYLIFGAVFALGLAVTILRRTSAPAWASGLAIGLTVPAVLLAFSTSTRPSASGALFILGLCSAALALLASSVARTFPMTRGLAFALGAVGLAAVAHLAAMSALTLIPEGYSIYGGAYVRGLARGLETVAVILDAFAVLVAASALSPKPRPGALLRPAMIVAFVLAFLMARQLVAGAADGGFMSVLLRRSLRTLLPQPGPYLPLFVQALFESLAVVVAVGLAFFRSRHSPLAGALALVVLARSAPEIPLAGLGLAVAALSVILVAHDGRTMWKVLEKSSISSSRPPS